MPPRPLPRAFSSRYSSSPPPQPDAHQDGSQTQPRPNDDEDIGDLAPDTQSLIGVSLGQRQAALASPSATTAERQAAYFGNFGVEDIIGRADFPDPGHGEEFGEDKDSDEEGDNVDDNQSPPSEPETKTTPTAFDGATRPRRSDTLPSPWRAGPNDAWIIGRAGEQRNALRVRPRASSGVAASYQDGGWKKFIPSLSKISMPRIKVSGRSSSPPSEDAPKASLVHSGSDIKDYGAQEPIEEAASTTSLAPDSRSYQSIVRPDASRGQLQRPTLHRRTTSDGSLYLNRSLSYASSLGDDNRWVDVHEQVNSRMKAIKDSFSDSNFKLPKLPNVSLPSFNPSWLDLEAARTRSMSILAGKTDRSPSPRKPGHHPSGHDRGAADSVRERVAEAKEAAKSPPPGMTRTNAAAHPQFTKALKKLKGDVVVLGGYRGSVLRSAEPPHRQVWVPIKVGLNLRKVNLELGLDREDDAQAEDHIIPSGMLKNIGPVDISRRLFKRLASCKNSQDGSLRVWDYGYDWRLNPHLLSAQLIQFLESLPCNSPGTPAAERGATVIAHSLGGLVTRHAVNTRPELFGGVLYAGVPQSCVNILGPLRNGDDVLISSKVLTAQVNFTIRTSFALLPLDGKCFFNKETKERYDVDFFDPHSWDMYCLSPVANRPLPPFATPSPSGPLDGLANSMASVLPSLNIVKRRNSSPKPPSAPSPFESTGTGPSQRAVGVEMGNRGETVTQHHENPETNISTAVTIAKPAAMAYLSHVLADVKRFKEELAHNATTEAAGRYPPFAVIYGKSVPTVYGAQVRSREAIRHADAYDNLAFASGDGVVLARASQLPTGYRVARGGCVSSERGHISLLGDLEAVGRCLNAIRLERSRRGQEIPLAAPSSKVSTRVEGPAVSQTLDASAGSAVKV